MMIKRFKAKALKYESGDRCYPSMKKLILALDRKRRRGYSVTSFDELRRHFTRLGVKRRDLNAAVRWARRLRVAKRNCAWE